MDPLTLVREWTMSNRTFRVEDGIVHFGDIQFPLDAPTAYKASRAAGDKYYKLSEILFALQHADQNFAAYLKSVGKENLKEFVARLDYADLLDYLRGRKTTTDRIDTAKLAGASALGKRASSHDYAGGVAPKHARTGDAAAGVGSAGMTSQGILTQLLKNKHERQEVVIRENGANGDPLVYGGDEDLVQRDRDAVTAMSALEAMQGEERNRGLLTPETNFKVVADMADALLKKARDGAAAAIKQPAPNQASSGGGDPRRRGSDNRQSSSSAAQPHGSQSGGRQTASEPIIIVPNGPSDLITIANVGDFLEKAHFVTPEERKKRAEAAKKIKEVTISKALGGGDKSKAAVRFKVIHNAMSLSGPEWDSVVAVFSNGKTWQFEQWRYTKAVQLFSHCFGAVVHYDDEPVPTEVKGWNVKFFKVNKTKRHLDGAAVSAFWAQLEEWLRMHKPWVLQQQQQQQSQQQQQQVGGGRAATR